MRRGHTAGPALFRGVRMGVPNVPLHWFSVCAERSSPLPSLDQIAVIGSPILPCAPAGRWGPATPLCHYATRRPRPRRNAALRSPSRGSVWRHFDGVLLPVKASKRGFEVGGLPPKTPEVGRRVPNVNVVEAPQRPPPVGRPQRVQFLSRIVKHDA